MTPGRHKSKLQTGVIVTIAAMIIAGAISWGAVQEKMSNMERVQEKMLEFQDKLFDFTMNLWKIDPDTRTKWSKYPFKPTLGKNGDTAAFMPWVKFEGLKRFMIYKVIEEDSTGRRLYVDTLFEFKEDSM